MKLISGPLSLYTAKVRIALREKGIGCDVWSVPFCRATGYEPKPADVLRLHPKGQVPILVDGELVVYDSTQILEYLEERNPEPPLYPSGLTERARCREVEAYSDEVFFPKVFNLVQEVFYKPDPAAQDAERVAQAQRQIGDDYDRFERRLAGRGWFCPTFSVADIAVFMSINYASTLGCPPPEKHRSLAAWLARTAERPSVAEEMRQIGADAARVFAGETLPEGLRAL